MKKYSIALLLLLALCGGRAAAQPIAVIPVVFHVVYGTAQENVPDSCLQHQIDVWNEDFNAQNADLWKVPAAWQPIIGSLNVQFVLASVDPQGNPHSGVERRQNPMSAWPAWDNDIKFFSSGGLNSWTPSQYLNVWVCDLNSVMGWAQTPFTGPSSTDGIVMDCRHIGRGSYALAPYDHGRAGTHVLAQWLGLLVMHDNNSCADTDTISDTPPYSLNNIIGSYPPGTVITDVCNPNPPGIMWMNFMMLVADTSMYFFTQGQVDVMSYILHLCHTSFLTGVSIEEHEQAALIDVFPNPSGDGAFSLTRKNAEARAEIFVYDLLGEIVSSSVDMQAGEQRVSLDLSRLSGGIYTVVLRSREGFASRRVLIAR